jgi:flagellar biosynthesis/type III secretory pathway chaperone
MTPATALEPADQLELVCERLQSVLAREYAVLRAQASLGSGGIDQLEGLHSEKERLLRALEANTAAGELSAVADNRRESCRAAISKCKSLQTRNFQLFGRMVAAQRKVLSLVRSPGESLSLYDRTGRGIDHASWLHSEVV